MSKHVLKARWLFVLSLLLLAMVSGSFLLSQNTTKSHAQTVKAQSVIGDQIVSFAQNIQNGDLGTGRNPDVCVPNVTPVECVQYSWGAGHGSKPGLSLGTCDKSYIGPQPCHADITVGLDCSGFTRWVYDLAYNKDILGGGTTTSQASHLTNIKKIPNATPGAGDLVFFAHKGGTIYHVGVYVSTDQMIDSPKTNSYVRQESIKSFTAHTTNYVYGYYRYVVSQHIPQLAASYAGTVHNITYNVTANFALSSITEDQKGNISGQTTVSLPLYGSGPFTGTVSANNTINFTSIGSGTTITFTGTVNPDKSLSGNYTVINGQIGTWSVS